MYTPIAVGLGTATVAATAGSALPGSASSGPDPMVSSAHQVLAFTGFAFGAYVALGLVLIITGLVIRYFSTRRIVTNN